MDLFGKSPRPVYNDAMAVLLAEKVGGIVFKWCEKETPLEDCIESAKKVLRFGSNDDGYELAKSFEDEGYAPNADLVELLDGVWYEKSQILSDAIKAWVVEDIIQPELTVGAKVKATIGGKLVDGEIVVVDIDRAQYGVWVASEGKEKGKHHYCVDYEKVNVCEPA